MSSSIHQGLQQCLEPRLIEPRVLRLKLTPSKSNSFRPTSDDSKLSAAAGRTTTNDGGSENGGGWSFLKALSSASESSKKDHGNEKAVYVHPLMKQSSATLSEKSLEMCTESLGSETGSEMSSDDQMSLFPSDEKKSRVSKLRDSRASKKLAKARSSFPPPLTSINGPIGIKVKPHREDGRLVLRAESFPSVKPCFQVERGGGRLRLRLSSEHCFSGNDLDKEVAQLEEDVEEEEEEGSEDEECGEAEGEGEAEEGIEENNENVGGEMGVGKRLRPSRCKEGGRGRKELPNWEPFLVST